jgi:polyisoprenoid-binding protein YceI
MASTRYTIDPTHSQVGFAVKHLVISTVRGRFTEFTAEADVASDDPTTGSLSATIQATSVDTGVADRDNHLRSPDFFDVQNHPTITFKSTSIEARGDSDYAVTGDLTVHGVTRPVTLAAEIEGPTDTPFGDRRFGISAKGKINRSDFGLSYSQALETGGLVVAEEVRLELEAELVAVPATETVTT